MYQSMWKERGQTRVNLDSSKSNWMILWPAGLLTARISRFNQTGRSSGSEMLGATSTILKLGIGFPLWFCALADIQHQWVGQQRPFQESSISFYTRMHMDFLEPWSVRSALESFMRTLEKSLTTSHPFHAKLVCQWPQINYQESGKEQMWPTPNWLHQHSLSLSLCLFFFLHVSPALLSPLYQKKFSTESMTVLKLTLACVLHITSTHESSLVSLYKLFIPTEMQSHWILRGVLPIPFPPQCGCMYSNKCD